MTTFYFNDSEIHYIELKDSYDSLVEQCLKSPTGRVDGIEATVIRFYEEGDLVLPVEINSIKYTPTSVKLYGKYIIKEKNNV